MRILYDSKNEIFKTPFGCLKEREECTINIRIPLSCHTKKVWLCFEGQREMRLYMEKTDIKDSYETYSVTFSLKERGLYFYYFNIETEMSVFDLFKEGFSDTNICIGEKWQVSCVPEDFLTDDFFKGQVMYQIFPDRFSKSGECDLSEKLTPFWIHKSPKESPHFLSDEKGEILNNDFFGGNLKGITGKLPYLKELGVGVIYLNPIFKAFSNHRYDTCDYKKVDPMLGTEEDFKILCTKAHSLGIKIILDGVFSHTGADSVYFDIKNRFKTGVMSNANSPFKSWYNKNSKGDFEYWWGIGTLPCVDELSKEFVEYVVTGEDSVIKHWMHLGADGFRLDVADELPDEFIKLLHTEVHKTSPSAIVIGEVWEDASNKISYGVRRRYFTDGELDSVMNYPMRDAIINLVTDKISTRDFAYRIMEICENYPEDVLHSLMNSLSTHDTPRIMTVLSGAPLDMERKKSAEYVLSPLEEERAFSLIKPAVVLQFFLPGSASIYYGDENGTFGFGDPFNRGFFDWENTENEISDFYRKLAKIKNETPALKDGRLNVLSKEDNILVMERTKGDSSLCLAMNFSPYSLRLNADKMVLSHNATIMGNTIYVQKNGFVLY